MSIGEGEITPTAAFDHSLGPLVLCVSGTGLFVFYAQRTFPSLLISLLEQALKLKESSN